MIKVALFGLLSEALKAKRIKDLCHPLFRDDKINSSLLTLGESISESIMEQVRENPSESLSRDLLS